VVGHAGTVPGTTTAPSSGPRAGPAEQCRYDRAGDDVEGDGVPPSVVADISLERTDIY
jgi:hypothetical protein